MGCWNGTCAVTRLPIFHGDPVVGFLLAQCPPTEGIAGGFYYTHGLWSPRAPHFFAKYNDYGAFEDIEVPDWVRAIIEADLRKAVLPMDEDKYRAKAIVPSEINFDEELFRQIREDRVTFHHRPYVKVKIEPKAGDDERWGYGPAKEPIALKIGFMMVHRFVFDYMIGLTVGWRDVNRQSMLADAKEKITEAKTDLERSIVRINEDAKVRDDLKEVMEDWRLHNKLEQKFEISGLLPRFNNLYDYRSAYLPPIIDAIKSNDETRLDDVLGYLTDFGMFATAMDNMRSSWAPQGGAGSQSGDLDLYKGLNAAVTGWIKEREDEFGEWDDEDEEDEA